MIGGSGCERYGLQGLSGSFTFSLALSAVKSKSLSPSYGDRRCEVDSVACQFSHFSVMAEKISRRDLYVKICCTYVSSAFVGAVVMFVASHDIYQTVNHRLTEELIGLVAEFSTKQAYVCPEERSILSFILLALF